MNERQFLHFTRSYQIECAANGRFYVAQIDPLNLSKPSAEKTVGNIFEVMTFIFIEENKFARWDDAREMLCEWTAAIQDLTTELRAARLA